MVKFWNQLINTAINKYYNKRISYYREVAKRMNDKDFANITNSLTMKINHKTDDYMHKASILYAMSLLIISIRLWLETKKFGNSKNRNNKNRNDKNRNNKNRNDKNRNNKNRNNKNRNKNSLWIRK